MGDIEAARQTGHRMPLHLTVLGFGEALALYNSTDCPTYDQELYHSSH